MLHHLDHRVGTGLAALATALLLSPAPLAAQAEPDFLFERPRVTVGLHGGWTSPRAGSDLFEWTRTAFTVDEGDFAGGMVSGELAYRLTERLDVGVEVGYAEREVRSEDREFIGVDDLPIVQTTTFARAPVAFNVKGYLLERGRSVSRFAWVPNDWSPWVGAGVGFMYYRWEQQGEFVDEASFDPDEGTFDIHRAHLTSEGWGPMLQLTGGADVSVHRRLLLTGGVTYSWASASLDRESFEGFQDLDLAGLRAVAGLKIRL